MQRSAELPIRSDGRAVRTAAVCALAAICTLDSLAGVARAEPVAAKDAPDLSLKRLELRGVEDTINASSEQRRQLEGEVATLRADRERLNQNLLEAAERLRAAEERAGEIEQRLEKLTGGEEAIVKSLDSRRAVIGEVLAVLQRMGRRPPPALLARPEDILEAIRASLALGAMLPQMRAETQALQADLTELARLRDGVRTEQARLAREQDELKSRRERLAPMIEARQQALSAAQGALDAEAARASALAGQATSLKDLIGRMEAESAAARKAAEAARQAEVDRAAADAKMSREQRAKALAAPFKDAARLAPAAAFADLKGRLSLPVAGPILKRYGAADGFGGAEKGLSIGAREHGTVASPCDGWIAFAGAYRGYGQLLIINPGAGYYVVLAGMSRTSVNVGQFVLAGEPVASMGDGAAQTAATIAIGAKQPILYVEFRKDGASIDPSPWWTKSDTRKSDIRKVGG
jgi:septal ring factor EnvC (AmiA/AmiB activator)